MNRLTLKETMDRLLLLIRSGYPVIYIVSHEESRVLNHIAKIARVIKAENSQKNLFQWYLGKGLEEISPLEAYQYNLEKINWLKIKGIPEHYKERDMGNKDPLDAIKSIRKADNKQMPDLKDSLSVFFDLHPFLRQNSVDSKMGSLVRPIRNAADSLRRYYDENRSNLGRFYKTIVIVAPSAQDISLELQHDIITIEFPLPEIDELRLALIEMLHSEDAKEILEKLPAEDVRRNIEVLSKDEAQGLQLTDRKIITKGILNFAENLSIEEKCRLCEMISGAGRGLSLEDYKRGLNMFAVRGEHLTEQRIEDMLNLKAKTITNKALEYTPHVTIELGGLEKIKAWIKKRKDAVVSESVREKYRLPQPKGVMLCGVSGGGKSQLAKLIAKEFNLALLRLDVGALFGMYVGESEERTRMALQLAEVLAPVVLWIDEADKAFSGVSGGGDSGVSARVFGHFLTWLSEKKDNIFVVITANDFRKLLKKSPEFARKGRFDEIFWVDLPGQDARKDIFNIYLQKLYKDGFLQIAEDEIMELTEENKIIDKLNAEEPFEKFCSLLSNTQISHNLTGAEIEHAINEALYEAYSINEKFSAKIILDTTKKLKDNALYADNSPDHQELQDLINEAKGKHWPFVK